MARAASSASRVLPTPAGPGQREQPHGTGAQPLRHRANSSARPIVRFGGGGSALREQAADPPPAGLEGRVVQQYRLVQIMQLGSRLDPQLARELLARAPVGLQRVGLTPARYSASIS